MWLTRQPDREPNWLLIALIGMSVLVHAGVVYEFRDVRQTSARTMIEVEMAAPDTPGQRSLPRPPRNPSGGQAAPENPDTHVPEKAPESIAQLGALPDSPADPASAGPDIAPQRVVRWQGPDTFVPENAGRAESDYLDRIRAAIEQNKQYPMRARWRRLEGRVTVAFAVDSKGHISDLSVSRGSGFPSLDEAALSAVRGAAPFAAPPAEMTDFPLRLEIPIVFRLAR